MGDTPTTPPLKLYSRQSTRRTPVRQDIELTDQPSHSIIPFGQRDPNPRPAEKLSDGGLANYGPSSALSVLIFGLALNRFPCLLGEAVLLRQLWSRWLTLAGKIGNFQSRILLTLFYFLVVAPFGLAVRLLSDPLHVRSRPSPDGSAWIEREATESDLMASHRQY